jgi:8-oxo-dGTP diphosphatase
MSLPYKIATLLYCFNEAGEILLLERAQEPNRGFWSPGGGKLKLDTGESPYACACRRRRARNVKCFLQMSGQLIFSVL